MVKACAPGAAYSAAMNAAAAIERPGGRTEFHGGLEWSFICFLADPSSTIWLLRRRSAILPSNRAFSPARPISFISIDIGGIGLRRPRHRFGAFRRQAILYVLAGKRGVEFLVQVAQ